MSDLYIMQNQLGLIKIGRSGNVEHRRRTVEIVDACAIQTVAILKNSGDLEETIHLALDDHRVIGEWFDGSEEARTAIVKAVCLRTDIAWPYSLADDDSICDWLDLIEDRRAMISADKAYQTCIREMRASSECRADPDRYLESKIWSVVWRFEYRCRTLVFRDKNANGDVVLTGHRSNSDEPDIIPRYTTDVTAALALWPDEDRPREWNGSAWECCIAAIEARKARVRAWIRTNSTTNV